MCWHESGISPIKCDALWKYMDEGQVGNRKGLKGRSRPKGKSRFQHFGCFSSWLSCETSSSRSSIWIFTLTFSCWKSSWRNLFTLRIVLNEKCQGQDEFHRSIFQMKHHFAFFFYNYIINLHPWFWTPCLKCNGFSTLDQQKWIFARHIFLNQ